MKSIWIMFAMTATCIWSSSTLAAEWTFFGSARMATFHTSMDSGAPSPQTTATSSSPDRDEGLQWALQGNSRFGGRIDHGAVSGRFEFGTGVNLRHLFGVWDYGDGQLLVGQSLTPLGSFAYSGQVFNSDNNLYSVGQVYNGRRPMIQLTQKGFKVALVRPHAATDLETGGDLDITWPKFEACYTKSWGPAFLDVFGGYQTYEISTGEDSQRVDAYAYGLGVGLTHGPLYVKAGVYRAKNAGQYGLANVGMSDARVVDGRLVDNETIGGLAVIGGRISDRISVEAGFGMTTHDLDDDGYCRDENRAVYAQLPLTLAPGVRVVPEVGYYDYRQDIEGREAGDLFYAGAKWQVDF